MITTENQLSQISELPDGTYVIRDDGSFEDYAAKWAYGYIVGIRPLKQNDIKPHTIFGVWTENQRPNSPRYFDIVMHVSDQGTAKTLARKNGQSAIWDLRQSKDVYV